ncbi:MAG: glucose 1-dehydrogenase [Elusimicrobiales bacterium]|nr:glucose 1-dehydrogenase [Elusimicrobiales bacterium]
MKSITITPLKPGSVRLEEVPAPVPAPGQTLVKLLEAGVCRTDVEIFDGLYGEPPAGQASLIMGHEALGQLENGDLVVPMVRRSCGGCANCLDGNQDMCSTGNFLERGIKGLDGMLCEYIAEYPRYLVPIRPEARPYAVLAEPMSVVAKGIRQAGLIQGRLAWAPKRALVLGAGPIGLLATMALRILGWETVTVARKPAGSLKAALAAECGALYVSSAETPVTDLPAKYGLFDLVFEATGSPDVAFDCLGAAAVNGVVCLTSVTGGDARKSVPAARLNRDLVLGNRVVFGTVNASRKDFEDGLVYLERINAAFPGLLNRLFTSRVPLEKAAGVFSGQAEEIKTVVEIAAA